MLGDAARPRLQRTLRRLPSEWLLGKRWHMQGFGATDGHFASGGVAPYDGIMAGLLLPPIATE